MKNTLDHHKWLPWSKKELREIIVGAYTQRAILFSGMAVALGVIVEHCSDSDQDWLDEIEAELMNRLERLAVVGISKSALKGPIATSKMDLHSLFEHFRGRGHGGSNHDFSLSVPFGTPAILTDPTPLKSLMSRKSE